MPRVHPNRSAGARPGVAFRGGSQAGAEHPVLAKRARRAKRKLLREAKSLEAKALIGSSDPKVTAAQLSILKRRWEAIDATGPEGEQGLSKRFEAACDEARRKLKARAST